MGADCLFIIFMRENEEKQSMQRIVYEQTGWFNLQKIYIVNAI